MLTSTFIRLRHNLHRLASGITGSRDDADDVLHDAFCKLWMRHREVKSEMEAIRLSYTAVRNSAIDELRHHKAHPELPIDTIGEPVSEPTGNDDEEATRLLCEALLAVSARVLKQREHEVFILHDVDNLSYDEISRRLGLTQDNIRQILSRSRKKLRQLYKSGQIDTNI